MIEVKPTKNLYPLLLEFKLVHDKLHDFFSEGGMVFKVPREVVCAKC